MTEEIINKVLQRMFDTNDYIIGVESRYYWANDDKAGLLKLH